MQLKLDLLTGSPWVLAIFMRSWLPFWKLLCLGEFTVMCSGLRLLLCRCVSYTLSSRLLPFGWLCAMALGPSDKLVGYWSNSSSSLILQYRFLSSLLCHCVLVEPPVSLCPGSIVLCSSLAIFFSVFCDLLLGAAPGYHRVLTDILTWVPPWVPFPVLKSTCFLCWTCVVPISS